MALKHAQRQASAAILSQLDATEPRTPTGNTRALPALIRRGYAKRKGDGFVRTTKIFVVGPMPKAAKPAAGDATDAYTMAEAAERMKMSEANVRSSRTRRNPGAQGLRARA
jgi:hypothetical protein